MAKDFALLAEAYTSIYEDSGITGIVASPLPSSTNITQQSNSPTSFNLQSKDSSKLIKNLNDMYLKIKENSTILIRNNIAGAKEQFDNQKVLVGQTIASIISYTSDSSSSNVYNGLISGIDKDLVPFVKK